MVFECLYELSGTSAEEVMLWGQFISPDFDDNWPWYLQTLIESGQIPKAFHAAEELLRLDAKQPVYEVFLVVCREQKAVFEAVYLPWRLPARFEEALRKVDLEALVQYFRLARQRYKDLREGPFASVVQRNVPRPIAPSQSPRQAAVHRPRLPIENFPPSGNMRPADHSSPPRKGKEGGVTPKRLEFLSMRSSSERRGDRN